MSIHETYANTTTVQGREADDTVSTTIPKPIAEELGLEAGDPVLWQCDEGDGTARIKNPC
ncbi:AbrB/MazE/SpoVT family DNA-binding domain-containing protein [Salinadaptatus halalkaliphilus]|uniref:AbrB/MazE/SpoVT family DNA-binding domain-containing protein n=1 Tax=Salinadaptatus halalkaliphilus TaxID=2419781 RepID=A0A4S3THK4_9EURY|nr:AbrB/MazE/SpoVT family DNA-binding domain-containing protein [Salinadaptatus halalkaliphilus]THE63396.1 AbrB/MazE/SpoVT family DNA-binding domain-containing protein [Salinadaptatus halalkaliphilus]